jgi:hypothetical protein
MPGLPKFLGLQSGHKTSVSDGTGVDSANKALPANATRNPEDIQLWLPSTIPAVHRGLVCIPGLAEAEEKLRTAQCHDALDTIRHVLKLKTRMVQFKNKNIRGQRQGTRSRAVIDRVHARARVAADKYRASRIAKLALSGSGHWEDTLRVLEDREIRSYQDPDRLRPRRQRLGIYEDDHREFNPSELSVANFTLFNDDRTQRDGTGETRRTLSWIWLNQSIEADTNDDILRAEWAKSRARAARAEEEVLLLKEEMRRTLAYLEWKAEFWMARANCRENEDCELREGLKSFALAQARLQKQLAEHFRKLWRAPLQDPPADKIQDAAACPSSTFPPPMPSAMNVDNGSNDDDDDDNDNDNDDDNDAEDFYGGDDATALYDDDDDEDEDEDD